MRRDSTSVDPTVGSTRDKMQCDVFMACCARVSHIFVLIRSLGERGCAGAGAGVTPWTECTGHRYKGVFHPLRRKAFTLEQLSLYRRPRCTDGVVLSMTTDSIISSVYCIPTPPRSAPPPPTRLYLSSLCFLSALFMLSLFFLLAHFSPPASFIFISLSIAPSLPLSSFVFSCSHYKRHQTFKNETATKRFQTTTQKRSSLTEEARCLFYKSRVPFPEIPAPIEPDMRTASGLFMFSFFLVFCHGPVIFSFWWTMRGLDKAYKPIDGESIGMSCYFSDSLYICLFIVLFAFVLIFCVSC